MKRIILLFLVCTSVSFTQTVLTDEQQNAFNSISADEILRNVSFLASDSLKGRAAGSDENMIASMFIARQFYSHGLTPVFPDPRTSKLSKNLLTEKLDVTNSFVYDEYFQKFNIKKSSLSEKNYFSIYESKDGIEKTINYKFGVDFLVHYFGAKNIKITAPVVFVGFGITDGPDGYDDFKNVEVKNKIVVIADSYPGEDDPASVFNKKRNSAYLNTRAKGEAAHEKGAAAVLVISSPLKTDPPMTIKYQKLMRSFERVLYQLPEAERESMPVLYISKAAAIDLFEGSGIDLKEKISLINEKYVPQSLPLPDKKVTIEINFDEELIQTQNVAGYLEGTDPEMKDELIVIGAHFDHVGLGEYGARNREDKGQIYNGADDNASGTSGLIELAEAFSKAKPKRSILFIAFNGEENGLLGSRYYTNIESIKPLEKTVAMINLDMIGRNDPKQIWVGGPFYGKDVKAIVEEANKSIGFELFYNVGLLNFASDQGPFLRKEIPAIFFFAGLHDDYHRPTDDVDKLDTKKIENVTKLAYLSALSVVDQKIYPKYEPLKMEEKTNLVKESLERQHKYSDNEEETE